MPRASWIIAVLTAAANAKLSGDFITGFETGMFNRDDPRAFQDYHCPRPKSDNKLLAKTQGLITPMKLVS